MDGARPVLAILLFTLLGVPVSLAQEGNPEIHRVPEAEILAEWPIRGVTGLRAALAKEAEARKLSSRPWSGTPPEDVERDIFLKPIHVGADGAVVLNGVCFASIHERKATIAPVTRLLDVLQKESPLDQVRLELITWEPFKSATVASFRISARIGNTPAR